MNKLNNSILLISSLLLLNCGGPSEGEVSVVEEKSMYGGVFRIPVGSYFTCIRPVEIQKLETAQVYDQIVESLVKYNPNTLEVEGSLSDEWNISEDGLTYTFNIREDIYFHDNDCFEGGVGRLLIPEDVKYTFESTKLTI